MKYKVSTSINDVFKINFVEDKQMVYDNTNDSLILTGAELLRTAIEKWVTYSDGNKDLYTYFNRIGLEDVLPFKVYKTDSILTYIELEDKQTHDLA